MTVNMNGNNRWAALSQEYVDASKLLDEAEANMKRIREEIMDIAATLMVENDDTEVSGHLLKVQRVERKGNVDYNRIPELLRVDLDQYRKPGSEYLKVEHL